VPEDAGLKRRKQKVAPTKALLQFACKHTMLP
jgi:hypothetical protein